MKVLAPSWSMATTRENVAVADLLPGHPFDQALARNALSDGAEMWKTFSIYCWVCDQIKIVEDTRPRTRKKLDRTAKGFASAYVRVSTSRCLDYTILHIVVVIHELKVISMGKP